MDGGKRRLGPGEPDLITLGGPAGAPVSHFRAAMLATAMTLLAVAPLFLLDHPPQLHRVTIDLSDSAGQGLPGRRDHRLDLAADERILLDDARCADLVDLRMGLDLIAVDPKAGVALRPDPEVRYETFLEVLALTRRANVPHLRVEIRPSAGRAEDDARGAWIAPRRRSGLPAHVPATRTQAGQSSQPSPIANRDSHRGR